MNVAAIPAPAFLRRPLTLLLIAAIACAGFAMISAPGAHAAATYKQTSCAKLSKKVKKSKGKARKKAKKKLTACKKANATTKSAFDAIKGGRYTGKRGDGASVDWTLCSSGAYTIKTTSGGSTGISSGVNWTLVSAKFTGSSFIAVIEDRTGGHGLSIGFARAGAQWQVGVSRSDGSVESLGNVTRTQAC